MHVGRFGQGLAEVGARAGARIFEHAPVTGAVCRAGRWRLTTPRGTIEAEQVLLATGSTTRGPFGWFRRRYVPVGSFIIATVPLPDRLIGTVLPNRRTASTSMNIGNYFRLAPDKRLIFGGRARFAMSSPRSDAKSGQILERVPSAFRASCAAGPRLTTISCIRRRRSGPAAPRHAGRGSPAGAPAKRPG
jgi:glycine/D-amino acid oxidase-like deaminating enzyme